MSHHLFWLCLGAAGAVLAPVLAAALGGAARADEPASPRLAHIVYFKLKDSTPESRANLVAACQKHLTDHPGTVFFGVGLVADDLTRPVNVRDFDVALHVVFENKAAHDAYQEAPRHVQFVTENKPTWESVRVFDSYLAP